MTRHINTPLIRQRADNNVENQQIPGNQTYRNTNNNKNHYWLNRRMTPHRICESERLQQDTAPTFGSEFLLDQLKLVFWIQTQIGSLIIVQAK